MQRGLNKPRVQELLQVELPQALLCSLLLRLSALPGGVAEGPLKLSLMSLVSTGKEIMYPQSFLILISFIVLILLFLFFMILL